MSRHKKHNLDYFSHDNGMRNDPKIKAVRAKFGLKGYAVYNMLLETLSEADFLCVKTDEIQLEIISGDFGVESGELIELIQYFEKIKLIKNYNGILFCPQLDKRAEVVFAKRTELLEDLRAKNAISVAETGEKDDNRSGSTQSKVKESKVKDIYIVLLNFWNSFERRGECPKHESKGVIWENIKKEIDKLLKKKETEEEIKQASENYLRIVGGDEYYFKYAWNFDEFLRRKNGYPVFKGDFEKLHNNYLRSDLKTKKVDSGIDVKAWKDAGQK